MSTSATEDRITRARELGLPTNSDEAVANSLNEDKPSIATGLDSQRQFGEFWFTRADEMPRRVIIPQRHWLTLEAGEVSYHHVLGNIQRGVSLFVTEKEAISKARQFRIDHIDLLQKQVNALDERYDAIEDKEMAKSK